MIADAHIDLGGYVVDQLDADERRAFEAHLEGCDACRRELAELRPLMLGTPLPAEWNTPAGLEARVLAAVQREAQGPEAAPPARARWLRRWSAPRLLPRLAIVGAVTATIAAIFVAGGGLSTRDGAPGYATNHAHGGRDGDALPIQLAAPDGGRPRAHALVAGTDSGAVVTFHSDHLPPTPTGQYYELWLVRPGDSPSRPNRISAGRFIPDGKGTTYIDVPAAASARAFGVIAITRERNDGNPAPSGPDIVRSDWSKRCGDALQAGC